MAGGKRIDTSMFNTQVQLMMKDVGIPGISLAIIENNEISYYNTFGYKSEDAIPKVNLNTLFEACSLSKSFLVFMVYQLVDQKRLDLDTPMYRYLDYKPLKGDERYKKITARMILSHTSGIENWRAEHIQDSLEILAEPGTQFVYSGEGYHYLARVIEIITQQQYKVVEKNLVFDKLGLKNTFSTFDREADTPKNYAFGHDNFGNGYKKWKNYGVVPAGGINTTAEDYARLLIAIFNEKHLSSERKKDILRPMISLRDYTYPNHYYGAGFELLFLKNDTLVAHGGSNPGFKGQIFYSVTKKRGLVLLTNSDRGKAIAERLVELTVKLNVTPIFSKQFTDQYPSAAIDIFNLYKKQGKDKLLDTVVALTRRRKLKDHTLNELGNLFMVKDTAMSKQLLSTNIKLYPKKPEAYYLLGQLHLRQKNYTEALNSFLKARQLHSKAFELEYNISLCRKKLSHLN